MKKILLLILTIVCVGDVNAQQATNEIDRLASKYKDGEDIVIYSTFGEIEARVSIERNADDKPESIEIGGRTNSIDAIAEIVYNLIQQKVSQGFRYYSGDKITDPILDKDALKLVTGLEHIKCVLKDLKLFQSQWVQQGTKGSTFDAVYKKGSLYFHVTVMRNKYDAQNSMSGLGSLTRQASYDHCQFHLVNGDNNRKGGTNAQKFDF